MSRTKLNVQALRASERLAPRRNLVNDPAKMSHPEAPLFS
jgi:hypothetical protein